MIRIVVFGAAVLALTVTARAQSPGDIFSSFEVTQNADGAVTHTADWYRVAANDPSIQPNQSAGGSYFVVAAGPDVTDFWAAAGRWVWFTPLATIAGNSYEIRFDDNVNQGADYFGGHAVAIPFSVWFLGATPDDPSDDVRMIPRVLDVDGSGTFSFALDHQASDGDDDPFSDWLYLAMPADAAPGQAGYDAFVAAGALDATTTRLHLSRVVLMNWNRRQDDPTGTGAGPIDAMPEAGTIFRITTQDVIAPNCVVTEFHLGSPATFALTVHEPVSGLASITTDLLKNATVSVPPFDPGTQDPVVVTGTITDPYVASVNLTLVDGAGLSSTCDKPRLHEVAIHDAGNLVLAMQPNSNFGTYGTSFPTTSGISAFWPKTSGTSHLFAANLWVAAVVNGEQRVMDNTFGPNDWSQTPGSQITYGSSVSDQDIGLTYDDRNAASAPIGLRVHQQSFQWSDPTRDDFVVLKYTFENTGENGNLTGLYPAIWTDTDIEDWTDEVAFDAARGMIYGYDDAGLGGYVGIKVLGGQYSAHSAYTNGTDPNTDADRFHHVTVGEPLPGGVGDMRMIVTAQPFDLAVGQAHTVVFAMVLGADYAELAANAGEMESVYAALLTDDDADGVPSTIEAAVPNPDGSGFGDGNGDGIDDVDQINVTSLQNDVDGSYVTFESEAGSSLIGVVATSIVPDTENLPATASFPSGMLSFGLKGIPPGAATVVTVYTNTTVNSYWKYGPTPDNPIDHWYDFTYDGTTGAKIYADGRIELHLLDGGRGDADLTANGRIQDPGAPVLLSVDAAFQMLRNLLQSLDLSPGHRNALTTKLDHAARKYAAGDEHAAAGMMGAFINQVRALSVAGKGKGAKKVLSTDDAEQLIAVAEAIVGQVEGALGKAGFVTAQQEKPTGAALEQNFPNPFNPSTSLRFILPENANVRLAVYDLLGRQVRLLEDGFRSAGVHVVEFDATGLSTGTYFYRLDTPQGTLIRQMTLMK